jgi:hypothetical protein
MHVYLRIIKYSTGMQELRVELQPGADEQQQAGQHQQLTLHAQFSQVHISYNSGSGADKDQQFCTFIEYRLHTYFKLSRIQI